MEYELDKEEFIKTEAINYFKDHILYGKESTTSKISGLKSKVESYYFPEYKAIFLDELKHLIINDLIEHRNKVHKGGKDQKCPIDLKNETLIFYINQELDVLPKIIHQRNIIQKQERNKVFISYSHEDEKYLNDIQRHFKPFHNKLTIWNDKKIEVGKKWKEEIEKAIKETKVAIFLVSTDFLGSDFIQTKEIPPLLKAAEEEGAVIINVILKPCLFEEFEDLSQYQAINPPSKPISRMDENEKEELFVNLVRQTKKLVDE